MVSRFYTRHWLIAFFVLILPAILLADTIEISSTLDKLEIVPHAKVYKDTSLSLSIDQIRKRITEFEPTYESQFNAAFENVKYWFYNDFVNIESSSKEIIYDVADPHINNLHLYVFQEDSLVLNSDLGGDHFKFYNRTTAHRTFIWKLTLKPNITYHTYLMVDMMSEPIMIPIEISDPKVHQSNTNKTSLFFGILIGLFFLYLFSSIILWLIYRQKVNLFFCIYVFVNFILILAYSGIGFQYLWPSASLFHNISRALFAGLTGLVFSFFASEVFSSLKTKPHKQTLNFFRYIIYALICILPFYREMPSHFIRICIIFYYFSILGIFATIIWVATKVLLRNNDFDSKAFLVAFSCLIIGFGANILMIHDIIPKNNFTSLIYYYAIVLELFIFLCYMSINVFRIRIDNQKKELQLNLEKNKALTNLITGAENERNRIATELHDSVGIELAMADLKLEQLTKSDNNNSFNDVRESIQKVSSEMRAISHQLSSVVLNKTGLVNAIKNLALSLNKASATKYFITLDENQISKLDKTKQLHIYRIIQEGLKNIETHAKAKNAYVDLHLTEDWTLSIRDDGIGIKPNSTEGIGLENIKSRTKLMHGKLDVISKSNKGSLMTISIPSKSSHS